MNCVLITAPLCIYRFVGPATRVRVHATAPRLGHRPHVRTAGDGVAETGRRFDPSEVLLHPRQVEALNEDRGEKDLVHLTGPPGTGKSLVLGVKGRGWARGGRKVLVVSGRPDGDAAAFLLHQQLQASLGPAAAGLVRLHFLELEDLHGKYSSGFDRYLLARRRLNLSRQGRAASAARLDPVEEVAREAGTDGELHVLMDEATTR